MNENANLHNLLSYSLGYIKLINPSLSRYSLATDSLSLYLDKTDLASLDPTGDNRLLIDLNVFYAANPKDVYPENKDLYNAQKLIAQQLEDIKNKHKIDEFTKQINFNFGYFKVRIPEEVIAQVENNEDGDTVKKYQKDQDFPLFYIPANIEFSQNKYYITFPEQTIFPNVGFLNGVLTDDNFFELIELLNKLENEGQLTLPINPDVINQVWDFLKAKLKLSKAEFGEDSFVLDKYVISLSAKSNYFLSSDLKSLVNIPETDLAETSLGSWNSDEELSNETPINEDVDELFFPFDYDKYQLRALSVIDNKAAIIEGPPGTGKSQTISNLLIHLAANGKRVLFLSQKAQALKVVKDKLKQLEIDFLCGYIPNRSSSIYSVQEEADGAAFTLAGLSQFINEASYQNRRPPVSSDKTPFQLEDEINQSIQNQRQFFGLRQRLLEINKYKIDPISPDKFLDRFTSDQYDHLNTLRQNIDTLDTYCSNYVAANPSVSHHDDKYKLILDNSPLYESVLNQYSQGIHQSYYDRDHLLAAVSNKLLLVKFKSLTDQLPKELYDELMSILDQKNSKHQKVQNIDALTEYFKYKNSIQKLNQLKQELELKLVELGLNQESLGRIDLLVSQYGQENTIALVKEVVQIQSDLANLPLPDTNLLNHHLQLSRQDHKTRIIHYLQNRLRDQIVMATFGARVKGIVARIAKALTKSKKAYRTFDTLKKDPINFKTIKELVPIWIMDLEDASRLIPLEKNLFDYIILDEASQCNLAYALPAMFRSKRVIFFGDSLQMRDDSIRFKTNRSLEELAVKYQIPEHLQIKSKEDSVKSVLDIGTLRGFKKETLLNHYRSPKEIIGFSNDYFYAPKRRRLEVLNANYVLIPGTKRILVNHILPPQDTDKSEKTNITEAEYIVDLIKKLQTDPSTKDLSIGVLTFFNEQAALLKEKIKDDNIKVSIIEGIQGDERDIIIYSFVINSPDQKNRYIYLTGEGGDIAKDLNAGRVNVAFSRARVQVHCVASLPPSNWPEGIWIKKYLEYVDRHGEINFFDDVIENFGSKFEEEFYQFILPCFDKKMIIQNQIESCGFKIDFVLTNPKNHKRLAVECDGPTSFQDENPEIIINSDIERQNTLQKAKWTFYRIPYSSWVSSEFDKNQIITDISNLLELD